MGRAGQGDGRARDRGRPRLRLAAAALLLILAGCAPPSESFAGADAAACRAVDGDTIECGAARIRLLNIDTPELHGKCAAEIDLAQRAQAFTAARLALGAPEIIVDAKRPRDRYGRTLAWVRAEGRDIGEDLIAAGLARRWDGRRRAWC